MIQTHPYTLEMKQLTNEGYFEGYASVFHVLDGQGDRIQPGAFRRSLDGYRATGTLPKMLWQHDIHTPIGTWTHIREDGYGLFVGGRLLLDLPKGQEAYTLLKSGAVAHLSIGFCIKESQKGEGGRERILTDVDLHEISLVTFAANPEAKILDVKSHPKTTLSSSSQPSYPSQPLPQQKGTTMGTFHSAIDRFESVLANYTATNQKQHDHTQSRLGQLERTLTRPTAAAYHGAVSAQDRGRKDAFLSYVRKGDSHGSGHLETKALTTTTDGDGGFLIPQILLSDLGKKLEDLSPMRRIANVIAISGSTLELLIDANGPEVAWVQEAAARNETGSPTLDKKRIPIHELCATPRATQKLLDDSAVNVEEWLIDTIAARMAQTENHAFINGDGQNKPRGFLHYGSNVLAQRAAGEIEHLASGANGAFGGDHPSDLLIDTLNALPSQYHRGACWMMSRSAHSAVRKLRDAHGQSMWHPGLVDGAPSTLLGYPVIVSEDMPALIAGTASKSIVLGNFKEAYTIVDRQDINVLRDPYSAKPHVEFYATKRVGGDLVNLNALKIINFTA